MAEIPCCSATKLSKNHKNMAAVKDLRTEDQTFSIEQLPPEVLHLILEQLDFKTMFNCLFVCMRWRSIILSIADKDKSKELWSSIYKQYHDDDTFQQNCNRTMSYKQLLENSLDWNNDFKISLSGKLPLVKVKNFHVYKDKIIVVTQEHVTYYDKNTFEAQCSFETICDYVYEDDAMMVVTSQSVFPIHNAIQTFDLYGKEKPDENNWELILEDTYRYSIQDIYALMYRVEENRCCVFYNDRVLYCYKWRPQYNPPECWEKRFMTKYYSDMGDVIGMNLVRGDVYLLTTFGALCVTTGENHCVLKKFEYAAPFSQLVDPPVSELVHSGCLVVRAPDDSEDRISRFRNVRGAMLYRVSCARLSCVTQHGDVLFLGFDDGTVKIFLPKKASREDILKGKFKLQEMNTGNPDKNVGRVLNIKVYEDFQTRHVFVATATHIHRYTMTPTQDTNLFENLQPNTPFISKDYYFTKVPII